MHALLTVLGAVGAPYGLVAAYVGYLALCRQVALRVERHAVARNFPGGGAR